MVQHSTFFWKFTEDVSKASLAMHLQYHSFRCSYDFFSYSRMDLTATVDLWKQAIELLTTPAYTTANIEKDNVILLMIRLLPFHKVIFRELSEHMSGDCHCCTQCVSKNSRERHRPILIVFIESFSIIMSLNSLQNMNHPFLSLNGASFL